MIELKWNDYKAIRNEELKPGMDVWLLMNTAHDHLPIWKHYVVDRITPKRTLMYVSDPDSPNDKPRKINIKGRDPRGQMDQSNHTRIWNIRGVSLFHHSESIDRDIRTYEAYIRAMEALFCTGLYKRESIKRCMQELQKDLIVYEEVEKMANHFLSVKEEAKKVLTDSFNALPIEKNN